MSSLVYEANARMRDPVYGCVGAISYLQNQVSQLQMQLALAQAEILCIQMPSSQDHQPPNYLLPMSPPIHELVAADDEKSFLNLSHYLNNFESSSSHTCNSDISQEGVFLWTGQYDGSLEQW